MRSGTNHQRGHAAEEAAATFLQGKGFTVLERRWRSPAGEIDLIACRESLLVFVEVKARAFLARAAESLSPRQQRRIAAAAEIYLASHPIPAIEQIRFDVILLAQDGRPYHIEGAFEAASEGE